MPARKRRRPEFGVSGLLYGSSSLLPLLTVVHIHRSIVLYMEAAETVDVFCFAPEAAGRLIDTLSN